MAGRLGTLAMLLHWPSRELRCASTEQELFSNPLKLLALLIRINVKISSASTHKALAAAGRAEDGQHHCRLRPLVCAAAARLLLPRTGRVLGQPCDGHCASAC